MGDILRNWIQARLGILTDLRPEVFGYYTRDGSLLAQILHSYDIITQDQLDMIIVTQDPALCRVNLRHLSFWLRFVTIKMDDDLIEEISCGKGTTSLRLFYKVYLCLESKDRLHFITLQKEREKFVPMSKKFDVIRVCEDPPPYQPSENKLSRKLVKGQDVIHWHQNKVPKMLRSYIKKKNVADVELKRVNVAEPCSVFEEEDRRKKESKELDEFAAKKLVLKKKLKEDIEEEESDEDLKPIGDDPDMAKSYIEWLKNRKKQTVTLSALKSKMHKNIISKMWESMSEKQERAFDEELAKRVLDQSRYEKQIMTKLCEIRDQKNIMAENQRVVEDIILHANEMEDRAKHYRSIDLETANEKDMKIECQRMCELRLRLHKMKIEKIRKKHWSLCQKVIDDLLIIAFNICEHRQLNNGQVPLTLISEWRRLFLKSEPIVEKKVPFDLDTPKRELETFIKADDWSKHIKIEVLQEILFDDYMELNEPWNFLLSELDEKSYEILKLGHLVLGYIVHRLLGGLYARPADPSKRLKIKMKNISIVLGLENFNAFETLSLLLEQSNFQLIRMEDAINHCLQQYKKEMADFKYIDLNIILATTQLIDVQMETCFKHTKRSRWADDVSTATPEPNANPKKVTNKQAKDKSPSIKIQEEEETSTKDKQTQTPRNIPYDDIDPILTDTAHIGKWAYEFLILGEPITNDLGTKIIIEYLKSKTAAKGWVFIDYPYSYDQMSWLETTLMGTTPPPNPKELEIKDINVEDIEVIKPRIVFEDKSDPYVMQRRSKILPDSITDQNYEYKGNTFVTLFVRLKQQPRDFEKGHRLYEKIDEHTSPVDDFYAFHKIAHVFHYSSFDLPTLKKLARLILGYPRKVSKELFGDILDLLELDPKRLPITKEAVVRRLVTDEEFAQLETLTKDVEEEEDDIKHEIVSEDFQLEFDLKTPKPGEPNWQWINFPLPSTLLQNMAKLWEILEDIYMEEVKELLYLKSVHSSSIIPYTGFLYKNAMEFIKRPDHKQDMIYEFQQAFNSIDMDARKEVDVKCELHRRVADFQADLWDICDERRRVAEEERKRYVSFEWAIQEAVILYDIFIGLIQAEIDRCIDTQHLLQDYYMGMLKKPLRELGVAKVMLNKIEVQTVEYEEEEQEEEQESPVYEEKLTDRKKKERSKLKTEPQVQISPPPIAICRLDIQKEINQVLLDRNKTIVNIEDTCMFKGLMKNIVYAREIMDTLWITIQETIKREQTAFKGKDLFFTDSAELISDTEKATSRVQDLFLEWRYVSDYEIIRIRQKLESIINVARLDFDFLMDTMQRTFHGIYDAIIDRYWQEMKSVNEMINVFCFAIEEGKMLEKEMELKGDKFIIRSNVYVVKVRPEKPKKLKEHPSMRFRIIKLSRLMDMFKRVAPIGVMCERTLVYILQDLVCHGLQEGEPMMLPRRWYDLYPEDISNLIHKIFKSVNYVDWREFLIYAMDIPYPTCREILITRDRLRIQDYELKEVITLAQYQRTSFWFFESTENLINLTHLQEEIDKLNTYEEEYYHFGVDKISILSKGIQRAYIMPQTLKSSCLDPEEALRRLLAKDLLGQMYMVDCELINYTALLLAFCKDTNPLNGFAMALALAIGNPVCTDVEEGEKYVKELLQQKQLAYDLGITLIKIEEAVKVAKLLINYILQKVEKIIEHRDLYGDEESPPFFKFFDEPVDPEGEEMEGYEGEIENEIETPPELAELIIYWISLDLCLTVLAAALPWYLLMQPDIIGPYPSMHEKLASIFEELRDKELNHEKNIVLAHRFLNHDFTKRLLGNISKFTIKDMKSIVEEVILERENAKIQQNEK